MSQVFLIGSASNFFADYLDVAQEADTEKSFLGIDNSNLSLLEAITRISGLSPDALNNQHFLCVPGSPGIRRTISSEAISIGLVVSSPLVHPSASLSRSLQIGNGSLIGRLVSGAAEGIIGNHCHLNRSASLGHHCVIEDFVTVAPAAVLLGGTTVRHGSFIGAGSVVLPGVTVGTNATVGAGAIVTNSVNDGATVVGNPAREVSYRI